MTQFKFGPYGARSGNGESVTMFDQPLELKVGIHAKGNMMVKIEVIQGNGPPVIRGGGGTSFPVNRTQVISFAKLQALGGVFGLPDRVPGYDYRCIYQLIADVDGQTTRIPSGIAVAPGPRDQSHYSFKVPLGSGSPLVGIFANDGELIENIGFILEMTTSVFDHPVVVDLQDGGVTICPATPITLTPDQKIHWSLGPNASGCTFDAIKIYEDESKATLKGGWSLSEPDIFPPDHYALGYTGDFTQTCLIDHQTEFGAGRHEESHWYSITIKDATGKLHSSDPELIDKPGG